MNKIKSLAVSGIATLVIGCSSYVKLSDWQSKYDFSGVVGNKILAFHGDKKFNIMTVMDLNSETITRYYDFEKNDLKIEFLDIVKDDASGNRIHEYYSLEDNPQVIKNAQVEFNKNLVEIEYLKKIHKARTYKIK